MKTHCDRCGKDCRYNKYSDFVAVGELTEVRPIYQTISVSYVCRVCGDKANSFVNYWGVKKKRDILALRYYLQSGKVSSVITNKAFSSLTNTGYY